MSTKPAPRSIGNTVFRKSVFSFFLAIASLAAYFAYTFWGRPHLTPSWEHSLTNIFYAIMTFFVSLFFHKVVSAFFRWYNENIVQKTQSTLDDKFLPLFHPIDDCFIVVGRFYYLIESV